MSIPTSEIVTNKEKYDPIFCIPDMKTQNYIDNLVGIILNYLNE